MVANYTKAERVLLKGHPELNEKWVQDRIAEDPGVLGLGDLVLRDRERIQPRAGRLDLLLQDPETNRRYEVELQLGATDETHIVRTLEYWDIERKRYPQYEHCAVLVAEDITSRFLNIIGLFNGSVPVIAIQMQACRVAGNLTLVFTTVVDELTRGLVDEDEDAQAAPTNREYWEAKGSKATLAMTDQLLKFVQELDPAFELKYNKFYIGPVRNGRAMNFVTFAPRREWLVLELKLPLTEELDEKVSAAGLEKIGYDRTFGMYRVRVNQDDLAQRDVVLKSLIREAYKLRIA